MAATMGMPSMAIMIMIMILLLNPTISNAAVNDTASNKWCNSALENCLVGDLNSDSEFLMETHTSRMLLDFQKFQTPNTNDANKQSVPDCDRPPRYDACTSSKRSISNPENCEPRNRANPCPDT